MPRMKVRGHRLNYLESGSGDAVLFVHAFMLDSTAFAAQVDELQGDYRCLAVDLWGHGGSDSPPFPWSWQGLTNDLIEFIHRLPVGPCHLVGHGAGGILALQVALDHPELVRSLVLIATPSARPTPGQTWVYHLLYSALRAGQTADVIRPLQSAVFGRPLEAHGAEGLERHGGRIRAMPANLLQELIQLALARDDIREWLPELDMPVLVVHDEENMSLHEDDAVEFAGRIRRVETVTVPSACRIPEAERSKFLARVMRRFLDRLAPADNTMNEEMR